MDQKKQILLYGPVVSSIDGAYGGGTGGYTRKVNLYLKYFKSQNFNFIHCPHTIKGQLKFDYFFIRFFIDMLNFLKYVLKYKPSVMHILAQYRTAIYREFTVIILSKIFRIPVVYEIKAGVFVDWIMQTGKLNRFLTHFCIKNSKIILGQGMPYIDYVKKYFPDVKAYYHPNFVPVEDIKSNVQPKFQGMEIKILFVGYAFREKGVFELVEACLNISHKIPIILTLVGKEHTEFKTWLDELTIPEKLKINRLGLLPNEQVIQIYDKNDIYCYPTYHIGEGHNNSINEAMMNEMIIVTTKKGFLGSVLNENNCYFIDKVSKESIAEKIIHINNNKQEAINKGRLAREFLMQNFTSEIVLKNLESYYKLIT